MSTPTKLNRKEFKQRLVAGSFPLYADLAQAMEGLRFIQADPIRSPARAQDLMLRQRVNRYQAGDLESGFPDLDAEEGFLFAYGFMQPPIWQDLHGSSTQPLTTVQREVLAFVGETGEVHPRDLDKTFGKRTVRNAWGGNSQATKRILEDLHHRGHLRVSRRDQGVRVYSPAVKRKTKKIGPKERYLRLAHATARVFGPTSSAFLISELAGLRHLIPERRNREAAIEGLLKSGQLAELEVEGVTYLWCPDDWKTDEVPDRVRVLAPFDPLVRNRQRFEQVWGWRYRFEAYVPAAKLKRGYYAMPLLWRDEVIGWANAKVEEDLLRVQLGYIDRKPHTKVFQQALESEVESMTRFLGLKSGSWELV